MFGWLEQINTKYISLSSISLFCFQFHRVLWVKHEHPRTVWDHFSGHLATDVFSCTSRQMTQADGDISVYEVCFIYWVYVSVPGGCNVFGSPQKAREGWISCKLRQVIPQKLGSGVSAEAADNQGGTSRLQTQPTEQFMVVSVVMLRE